MLVKDVMTSKKIYTLSPSDKFEDILRLLIKHKISGAPVVDKRGRLIGIVSEKDLFYKFFPSQSRFYRDPQFYMNYDRIEKETVFVKKLKAKDFMVRKIVTIKSDDHVLKACSLFIKHKIRRLPVLRDGKLVGIVTTNDVYKNFLKFFAHKA